MLFPMKKADVERLFAGFRKDEDCEEGADGSFTVDLYEPEPVLSVEVYPEKEGVAITAVGLMAYSEELDGWYMADKVKDPDAVQNVFERLRKKFL